MRTSPFVLLPVLIGSLSLAACDQPKWREKPAATPEAATAPATAAPKARVIPADPSGAPAAPEWAKAVLGKSLRDAYPKTGICKGNTDILQKTYAGTPAGVQVHGWGWDTTKKEPVARVVLVDRSFKIVGAGEGGVPRPDVPSAVAEITSPDTGWNADAAITAGPVDAYGVVGDGDSVCVLGHLEF